MKRTNLTMLAMVVYVVMPFTSSGQNFLNGDLDGIPGASALPTHWEAVPHTDPVCLATVSYGATPDLLDLEGPTPAAGVMGNPYAGNTFVSGLRSASPTTFWHEGIQQEVGGFTVGDAYVIGFYQTVVKQSHFLDSTGAWAVYLDTTLLGVSAITMSQEPFNSINLPWEYRSMAFTATATSHLIKFLPDDDDGDDSTTYGKLRMGIDNIFIFQEHSVGMAESRPMLRGIHPNPCDGRFTVDHGPDMNPERIEVLDPGGRVVHCERPGVSGTTWVDARGLGSGTYFVQVIEDGVRSAAMKLLVE